MNTSHIANELSATLKRRSTRLSNRERQRIHHETDILHQLEINGLSLNQTITRLGELTDPFYDDAAECLIRIHELAGGGSLASCQSSLPIVEAFSHLGLLGAQGTSKQLIVGRGHVAPAFYAVRHMQRGFPLAFLASVGEVVSPVVSTDLGFTNSMRHSLGYGLPEAVAHASNIDSSIVCFVGDGELHEGICFEAIRFAYEKDIAGLTVVIDANGHGIDKLVRNINLDYLQSFFHRVIEVHSHDTDCLHMVINQAQHSSLRSAIVVRTTKPSPHTFTLQGAVRQGRSCAALAPFLRQLSASGGHVVSPDMAGRFGLGGDPTVINTGLSEQFSVAYTAALPDTQTKILLTDDKFLLNSVDSLEHAFAHKVNFHVIAARKNGGWGGPNTTSNVFSCAAGPQIHELIDPQDAIKLIEQQSHDNQNSFIILHDCPVSDVDAMAPHYHQLGPATLLLLHDSRLLLVSTEGMSLATHQAAITYRADHLRILSRTDEAVRLVAQHCLMYDTILICEQGTQTGSLHQQLSALVPKSLASIHSTRVYTPPGCPSYQDAVCGRSLMHITETIKRNL